MHVCAEGVALCRDELLHVLGSRLPHCWACPLPPAPPKAAQRPFGQFAGGQGVEEGLVRSLSVTSLSPDLSRPCEEELGAQEWEAAGRYGEESNLQRGAPI